MTTKQNKIDSRNTICPKHNVPFVGSPFKGKLWCDLCASEGQPILVADFTKMDISECCSVEGCTELSDVIYNDKEYCTKHYKELK